MLLKLKLTFAQFNYSFLSLQFFFFFLGQKLEEKKVLRVVKQQAGWYLDNNAEKHPVCSRSSNTVFENGAFF